MPPVNDPRVVPRQSMAVPSERWFGLPKWAVIVIAAAGLLVAYYLYKHNQTANQNANTDVNPTTDAGLTAADVGGIPQDNSLGTVTDEMALEQQIQQLQTSLAQLEGSNGGNGGGVGGSSGGGKGGGGTGGGSGGGLPGNPEAPPANGNPNPSGVTSWPNTPITWQNSGVSLPNSLPISFQENPTTFGPNPPPQDLSLLSAGLTPASRGAPV